MNAISIVLIAKNEAHIIGETLRAAALISNDIIVVDSGSNDGTQSIARLLNATVVETVWSGFGTNKNMGIDAAKRDWILSIDADEIPDSQLAEALKTLDLSKTDVVYNIRFKTFFGNKQIRYGEWGNDAHIRLFNRTCVRWNEAPVHEQLVIPASFTTRNLSGSLLHYTMRDMADYATKMTAYALLNAERYHAEGKRPGWIKRYVSPPYSFIQNYFFKLGFLDGKEGYIIAKMTAYYTFLKYARAYELSKVTANGA